LKQRVRQTLEDFMTNTPKITKATCPTVLSAAVTIMLAGSVVAAFAEENNADPLVLKAQGSFFVGGETITSDATTGTPGGFIFPNQDQITVNQMYVQFQIPEREGHHVPVVLLHGCCLSGKTWETTPDGRMGWGEYFVRKGHAVYIPDQSSRARSGFDATTINDVRLGTKPPSALPYIFLFGRNGGWQLFRFGPAYPTAFSDEQFPVEAINELSKSPGRSPTSNSRATTSATSGRAWSGSDCA
jgi:hypothetical protein